MKPLSSILVIVLLLHTICDCSEERESQPYSFSYSVSAPDFGNFHGHTQTKGNDGKTKGSYYLLSPDGLWHQTRFHDRGYGYITRLTKEKLPPSQVESYVFRDNPRNPVDASYLPSPRKISSHSIANMNIDVPINTATKDQMLGSHSFVSVRFNQPPPHIIEDKLTPTVSSSSKKEDSVTPSPRNFLKDAVQTFGAAYNPLLIPTALLLNSVSNTKFNNEPEVTTLRNSYIPLLPQIDDSDHVPLNSENKVFSLIDVINLTTMQPNIPIENLPSAIPIGSKNTDTSNNENLNGIKRQNNQFKPLKFVPFLDNNQDIIVSKINDVPTINSRPKIMTEQNNSQSKIITEQNNSEPKIMTEQNNSQSKIIIEQNNPEPKIMTEQNNSRPKIITEQNNSEPKIMTEENNSQSKLITEKNNSQPEIKTENVNTQVKIMNEKVNSQPKIMTEKNNSQPKIMIEQNISQSKTAIEQKNSEREITTEQDNSHTKKMTKETFSITPSTESTVVKQTNTLTTEQAQIIEKFNEVNIGEVNLNNQSADNQSINTSLLDEVENKEIKDTFIQTKEQSFYNDDQQLPRIKPEELVENESDIDVSINHHMKDYVNNQEIDNEPQNKFANIQEDAYKFSLSDAKDFPKFRQSSEPSLKWASTKMRNSESEIWPPKWIFDEERHSPPKSIEVNEPRNLNEKFPFPISGSSDHILPFFQDDSENKWTSKFRKVPLKFSFSNPVSSTRTENIKDSSSTVDSERGLHMTLDSNHELSSSFPDNNDQFYSLPPKSNIPYQNSLFINSQNEQEFEHADKGFEAIFDDRLKILNFDKFHEDSSTEINVPDTKNNKTPIKQSFNGYKEGTLGHVLLGLSKFGSTDSIDQSSKSSPKVPSVLNLLAPHYKPRAVYDDGGTFPRYQELPTPIHSFEDIENIDMSSNLSHDELKNIINRKIAAVNKLTEIDGTNIEMKPTIMKDSSTFSSEINSKLGKIVPDNASHKTIITSDTFHTRKPLIDLPLMNTKPFILRHHFTNEQIISEINGSWSPINHYSRLNVLSNSNITKNDSADHSNERRQSPPSKYNTPNHSNLEKQPISTEYDKLDYTISKFEDEKSDYLNSEHEIVSPAHDTSDNSKSELQSISTKPQYSNSEKQSIENESQHSYSEKQTIPNGYGESDYPNSEPQSISTNFDVLHHSNSNHKSYPIESQRSNSKEQPISTEYDKSDNINSRQQSIPDNYDVYHDSNSEKQSFSTELLHLNSQSIPSEPQHSNSEEQVIPIEFDKSDYSNSNYQSISTDYDVSHNSNFEHQSIPFEYEKLDNLNSEYQSISPAYDTTENLNSEQQSITTKSHHSNSEEQQTPAGYDISHHSNAEQQSIKTVYETFDHSKSSQQLSSNEYDPSEISNSDQQSMTTESYYSNAEEQSITSDSNSKDQLMTSDHSSAKEQAIKTAYDTSDHSKSENQLLLAEYGPSDTLNSEHQSISTVHDISQHLNSKQTLSTTNSKPASSINNDASGDSNSDLISIKQLNLAKEDIIDQNKQLTSTKDDVETLMAEPNVNIINSPEVLTSMITKFSNEMISATSDLQNKRQKEQIKINLSNEKLEKPIMSTQIGPTIQVSETEMPVENVELSTIDSQKEKKIGRQAIRKRLRVMDKRQRPSVNSFPHASISNNPHLAQTNTVFGQRLKAKRIQPLSSPTTETNSSSLSNKLVQNVKLSSNTPKFRYRVRRPTRRQFRPISMRNRYRSATAKSSRQRSYSITLKPTTKESSSTTARNIANDSKTETKSENDKNKEHKS